MTLTACAQELAMKAAKKGNLNEMKQYIQSGNLTADEIDKVYTQYCAGIMADAMLGINPLAMVVAGGCYEECKSRSFCSLEKAYQLYAQAARYGVPAATFMLRRLNKPVPTPDLANAYQAEQNRQDQRFRDLELYTRLDGIANSINNLKERKCVYERRGNSVTEHCQ